MLDSAVGFLRRIAEQLWGKFESKAELRKFLLLGTIFGLIIGVYWTMRGIKDANFGAIVGKDYIAKAKMISVFISIPLVFLYTWLVDTFPRHRVFYLLISVYAVATLGFAYLFHDPVIGLPNITPDASRFIGWAWYMFVESFGSLIVALFWVLATDMTMPESAKRGFPIVAMIGQLGNIVGPYSAMKSITWFKLPHMGMVVAGTGVGMLMIGLVMVLFRAVTPPSLLQGYTGAVKKDSKGKKETGFFEGLWLLLSEKYLLGIFFIITVYEIIVTIIDNYFKVSVLQHFQDSGLGGALANKATGEYLLWYGTLVGIVAFACLLFGASNIPRKMGMRVSLLLLPVLVGVAMLVVRLSVGMEMDNRIFVMLCIMVLAKAVNYSLNQPTMKQLYIPTSHEARYKAQGWIEMFGSRSSKGLGSVVADVRKTSWMANMGGDVFYLTLTSVMTMGLVGVWMIVAIYVAGIYNKAIKEDKVVC